MFLCLQKAMEIDRDRRLASAKEFRRLLNGAGNENKSETVVADKNKNVPLINRVELEKPNRQQIETEVLEMDARETLTDLSSEAEQITRLAEEKRQKPEIENEWGEEAEKREEDEDRLITETERQLTEALVRRNREEYERIIATDTEQIAKEVEEKRREVEIERQKKIERLRAEEAELQEEIEKTKKEIKRRDQEEERLRLEDVAKKAFSTNKKTMGIGIGAIAVTITAVGGFDFIFFGEVSIWAVAIMILFGGLIWLFVRVDLLSDATNKTRNMEIGVGALVVLTLGGLIWAASSNSSTNVATNKPVNTSSPGTSDVDVPPRPRNISQPPNTNYYVNSKQNLKGDLLRNFVGFSIYYPKDWKVNGPQEGATPTARGKFFDITRSTPDGRLKEQMLITYYPSNGTFKDDADKFPQMVKESNDKLKKILPSYQMISEGEITVNGSWRTYEVKFQGGGTSPTGEKLVVWGRRLFIPAARQGVRSGFEITMLATSLADEVRTVDDVGVKGELAAILYSFEPSQNF